MGNVKSVIKEFGVADRKAMVCPAGLNIVGDMGIQRDMMAKTKMVMSEIKKIHSHGGGGGSSGKNIRR